MAKKRRRLVLALVGIIALLIILGVAIGAHFKQKKEAKYAKPKRGSIVEAIYGLGKVKTHRKYELKIGVMSTVRKVFVDEGDSVTKGDPIIKFADLRLYKAPFSGTITRLDYREPEVVFPNVPVLTLEDLDQRYIEVSLEQEGALRVRKDQEATILFESLRGIKYEGKVVSIFPKEDEFLVHIKAAGMKENILPGMSADVTINVSVQKDVLLVPQSGITNGVAMILRDGKKMKIPVKVGANDGTWAQILDGDIRENDEIVYRAEKE